MVNQKSTTESIHKLVGSTTPVEKTKRQEQRDKICFDVVKRRSSKIIEHSYPDMPCDALSHVSNVVIVHTLEGPLLVNACSNNYNLIPISTILDTFENALDDLFEYDVVYRHSQYSKFFIDYLIKMPMHVESKGKQDLVRPRIRVQHSYTGSLKYEVQFGFWREVCKNGMSIPVEMHDELAIQTKHTKFKLESGIDQTMQNIGAFVNHADDFLKPFDAMTENMLGQALPSRLDQVMENTGLSEKLTDSILLKAGEEMAVNDYKASDWILYNAINYQLNHNHTELKIAEWKRQQLDTEIINYLSLN